MTSKHPSIPKLHFHVYTNEEEGHVPCMMTTNNYIKDVAGLEADFRLVFEEGTVVTKEIADSACMAIKSLIDHVENEQDEIFNNSIVKCDHSLVDGWWYSMKLSIEPGTNIRKLVKEQSKDVDYIDEIERAIYNVYTIEIIETNVPSYELLAIPHGDVRTVQTHYVVRDDVEAMVTVNNFVKDEDGADAELFFNLNQNGFKYTQDQAIKALEITLDFWNRGRMVVGEDHNLIVRDDVEDESSTVLKLTLKQMEGIDPRAIASDLAKCEMDGTYLTNPRKAVVYEVKVAHDKGTIL